MDDEGVLGPCPECGYQPFDPLDGMTHLVEAHPECCDEADIRLVQHLRNVRDQGGGLMVMNIQGSAQGCQDVLAIWDTDKIRYDLIKEVASDPERAANCILGMCTALKICTEVGGKLGIAFEENIRGLFLEMAHSAAEDE